MTELREAIIQELKVIIEQDYFEEIAYLLKKTSQFLTLDYVESMDSYDISPSEFSNNICYIYSNEVYDNLELLYLKSSFKEDIKIYNLDEYCKDLEAIFQKLLIMARLGYFDNLKPLIEDLFYDYPDKEVDSPWYYLEFSILGKSIFTIVPYSESGDQSYWESIVNLPNFKEIIRQNIKQLLPDIKEIKWFNYFEEITKNILTLASNTLRLFYTNRIEDENLSSIDYSAILLPFVKALENEITYIFRLNGHKLIKNSKIILDHLEYKIGANKVGNDGDLVQLKNLCESISKDTKRKNNYSIFDLYLIFKYFISDEDYNNLKGFEKLFTDSVNNLILRDQNLFNEMKQWGIKRNIFVHSDVIDSENEFNNDYNHIFLLLKLVSQIKFLISKTHN